MLKILREEPMRNMQMHGDDGNMEVITFTAKWPRLLHLVRPYGDAYGAKFEIFTGGFQTLTFWLLSQIRESVKHHAWVN